MRYGNASGWLGGNATNLWFVGFRDGKRLVGCTGLKECKWVMKHYVQKHAHLWAKANNLSEVWLHCGEIPHKYENNDVELRKYLLKNGRKLWDKESYEAWIGEANARASSIYDKEE